MTTTIQDFVAALSAKWPKKYDDFCYSEGKKYWKIILKSKKGTGRSVYAFVDKVSGALYKPASWNAPSLKHIRGNINDPSGLEACHEYSVVYLR